MKKILTRRDLLLGTAAVGGVLVTGCDESLYTPPQLRPGAMGLADALTMASQRLLLTGQPLVKEFERGDISKDFPVWNESNPEDEAYQRLLRDDFKNWRIPIEGLVNRPVALSLDDLKRMPRRNQITMHICEQGWSAVAEWSGVQLLDVIRAAGGVTAAARYVVINTMDGWYEGYDMFDVVHPQTILAYGLNGKDLPVGNGAPVRLRVERQCGYKNLKFLKSIKVVSSFKGIGKETGGINSDYDWHWYGGS